MRAQAPIHPCPQRELAVKHSNAGAARSSRGRICFQKHGLQFARRPGKKRIVRPESSIHKPGRQSRADFPALRAFRNIACRTFTGDLAPQLPEAPLNVSEDQIVELQFGGQKLGDGFAREVVSVGPRPPEAMTSSTAAALL